MVLDYMNFVGTVQCSHIRAGLHLDCNRPIPGGDSGGVHNSSLANVTINCVVD